MGNKAAWRKEWELFVITKTEFNLKSCDESIVGKFKVDDSLKRWNFEETAT